MDSFFSEDDLSGLPAIRLKGMIELKGRSAACVNIEGIGAVILKERDKIILTGNAGSSEENSVSWFIVRNISNSGMSLELNNGSIVMGKFY